MDPEQLEKIMHNGGHTRRGTANEKGAGIGMALIREFTSLHRGKLDIQSEEGQGTRIVIDFPKDRHE
jgi:signal transduction histidine kinase